MTLISVSYAWFIVCNNQNASEPEGGLCRIIYVVREVGRKELSVYEKTREFWLSISRQKAVLCPSYVQIRSYRHTVALYLNYIKSEMMKHRIVKHVLV